METKRSTTSLPEASSEEIEEVKPLPLGFKVVGTPSHSDQSGTDFPAVPPGFQAKEPAVPRCTPKPSSSTAPINAIPISFAFPASHKPDQGRRRKTPDIDKETATKKVKPVVRSLSRDLVLLASSSNAMTESRSYAEAILSTFDALRRRLEQIDEADGVKKRPDMKAEVIMNANDLMANKEKRVGAVPGVEVGDIFYFRMEMCVVGLHALPMAGIDYMNTPANHPIAISIVSSGGYEDEDNAVDVLVYTGQGGNSRKAEKRGDQKLERGNFALEQSAIWKNPIRVIRSRKDPFNPTNKVYIYDGLYEIRNSWTEKAKSGFKTFKHKLVRQQGQPDGFAVWKRTEEWKIKPSSRGAMLTSDLSSGTESIPVTVVNDVDDEPEPDNFSYVTTIGNDQTRRAKENVEGMALEGCECKNICIPGDAYCYCASENGGCLPYSGSGLLVKRLPVLYECGLGCDCTINCRNRVTQRGVKLHFEVFRTQNRGWSLRSWDPIRAGSFVCEFVGKILENPNPDSKELVLNEYLFWSTRPGKKALKWNMGMELATGDDGNSWDLKHHEPEPVPPVISAEEMGNVSRFINHSCDPNLFWQLVRYWHGDEPHSHIGFFAMKHIPPMTELTYDYDGGTEGSRSRGVGARKCLCGASNCRGHFG